MILTDKEIRQLCIGNKNNKIADGMIDPFDESALQSESYDLAMETELRYRGRMLDV